MDILYYIFYSSWITSLIIIIKIIYFLSSKKFKNILSQRSFSIYKKYILSAYDFQFIFLIREDRIIFVLIRRLFFPILLELWRSRKYLGIVKFFLIFFFVNIHKIFSLSPESLILRVVRSFYLLL